MNRFNRLVLSLSFAGSIALAQESPRLVIDPHGHSGMIGEMVFTPDGSRLITVSDDKTVRIWALNTGGLLKTLRTFRGDSEDGKHFTCAISPDGKWLAVGGWASSEGNNYGAVTVIDLDHETVAVILQGHTDVVHSLSFSPDGSALLSASSDNSARVWNTAGWQSNPEGSPAPTGYLPGPAFEALANAFFADPETSTQGW
ncbi:MAG: hypothetical protein AAF357_19440, partial [Verrucomicrobiota bacterium]